jgi:hypothetical protein
MQMKLQRRPAVALDHIAVEINGADVGHRELAALAGADVDEHAVTAQANAGVAVVVDDVGLLEHADARD